MSFDLGDYVDVAERISVFAAKHPDGSLQSEIVELTENRVVVKAYAFRTPDDPRPGTGHSALSIPGATPYTRGSEIENAETSAFGRAIVALGFPTKKVASADEVRAHSGGEPGDSRPVSEPETSSPATAGSSPPDTNFPMPQRFEPTDAGQPADVVITFGKHKDKKLSEVPRQYLEWLVEKFEAKTPEQRRILFGAKVLLGLEQGDPNDPNWDIPF